MYSFLIDISLCVSFFHFINSLGSPDLLNSSRQAENLRLSSWILRLFFKSGYYLFILYKLFWKPFRGFLYKLMLTESRNAILYRCWLKSSCSHRDHAHCWLLRCGLLCIQTLFHHTFCILRLRSATFKAWQWRCNLNWS